MAMSFAIGLPAYKPADFIRQVALSEQVGFDMVSAGDSAALIMDSYVALTLAALNTKTCKLGVFVTNPLVRHPVVAAGAISSIDVLSNGRAVLGMATGYSGVANLGMRPSTTAALEEYVLAMKSLWATSTATYQGKTIRMMWARKPVPVYITASGPKVLRMAARVADGVMIGTGLTPEIIQSSLDELEKGAREAGRRVEDIDVWWFAKGNLGASKEAAGYDIRSGLASSAGLAFSVTLEGKQLPPKLVPAIKKLMAEYDFTRHVQAGVVRQAELVDELGLRDYLVERFAIVGTPADWISTIRKLEKQGVRKLFVAGVMPDRDLFISTLGREVLPAFKR